MQESYNVYRELTKPDLPAARTAVSRIVGRDTQALTAEGVTKAAVETVAENASDGVIAPLLYMLLGGAPLALTYKAINTMDSMVGYKNTQYLYFWRVQRQNWTMLQTTCPAALPLCCGWPLPLSRETASRARGGSGGGTGATTLAQTVPRPRAPAPVHSNVQLAGPAYYFGKYYPKPTIGDAVASRSYRRTYSRADRMMYAESLLALVLGLLDRAVFVLL